MHRDSMPGRATFTVRSAGCLAALLLGMLVPAATVAADWPDTPLARTEALALLQTLNAELLSHPSATLTLERWCGSHRLAAKPTVVALRDRKAGKPLPDDLRRALGIDAGTPVRYRRVQLACGNRVLSEADNWYLPGRLTTAMNQSLDQTDTPFGKVVAPLHFRRHTLSARLLWSPLPDGWAMDGLPPAGKQRLVLPHQLLQHRALLEDEHGHPFSALVETYTDQVLAFPPPAARD
ncbi:MAG TPA: hypothetical protein VFH59_10310 [Frateuria sp.]|uniref:hypothetical protein n=1 Tax=Frateuria sp. TaxID=2211372 RepID=UPI002D7F5AC1|nr:hypothetical protein [Frateuria sp.]HET6805818.1 hypothetical protein [Frateuria sp.]